MSQITPHQELTNSQFVIRSNALIEASYRLSQTEQMLLIFATKEAHQTQTGYFIDKPCVIRVADYAKAFGLVDTRNLYRDLKTALNRLYERSVYAIYSKDGNDFVEKTRWITQTVYSDQCGYLSLSFAPEVVPFLLDIDKNFTRYDLLQIGKFTSGYAVRLFEILRKHKAIGHAEITIEWLRTHLQLGTLYPLTADLKRKVIDESIKQINLHSDIKITYKLNKRVRKVHSFTFTIRDNVPKEQKPKQKPQKQGHWKMPPQDYAETQKPINASMLDARPIEPGKPPPPEIQAQLQQFLKATTGKE